MIKRSHIKFVPFLLEKKSEVFTLFLQNNNKLIKEVFNDYLITFCRDDKEEPNIMFVPLSILLERNSQLHTQYPELLE